MRKNLAELEQLVQQKQNKLVGTNTEIVSPNENLDPSMQAQWMIHLLNSMYVSHGISKSPKKLQEAISAQQCRPWFAVRDNFPVASAALITQADGSVELGRAVALEQGNGAGGLVMLMAALEHLRNSNKPLVAEVRAPTEIGGIASGEATQRICIRDIGMNVHAIGPFFGHGLPFRHEPFMLSSTQEPIKRAVVFAGATTDQTAMVQKRLKPLISTIAQDVQFRSMRGTGEHIGWETVTTEPFTVQVPNEEVSSSALEHQGFTLKLVESSPANAGAILACLASEVLLGVDRNMGKNGFPVLLFGHLHRSKIIAPLHLSDVIPKPQRDALLQIDDEIRERQRRDDKQAGEGISSHKKRWLEDREQKIRR